MLECPSCSQSISLRLVVPHLSCHAQTRTKKTSKSDSIDSRTPETRPERRIFRASQQSGSAGGQGTGPSSDSNGHAERTRLHLAQARLVNQYPLPRQARHAPILRANPYPEVTDPICRLPLPTLFYRLEALHLGDLLRIWVRTGATPPRGPLPDFQGPRGRSGHRGNCGALRVPNHISLLEDSMELERSCRKENSSRISRRRLRVFLGYPDELSCEGPTFKRFRCQVPE
ncbi:hypothetical protein ABEB36_015858 [Hypothenemus hampei]|uniref:C2H2-type domain-containing protein n=1 Tax=Hypothenemus hampei TaxID=57062 RepID=A0ABD1E358_HYPHA